MPLDMGDIAESHDGHPTDDRINALRPVKLVLSPSSHVGAALRAARMSLGLAEEDIAQVTRVRAPYIGAIEAFDFEALPPRPFVVGYIRAYAQALGLDADAVVVRFHAEAPKVDGKLRAPGGVRYDAFARIRWLLMIAAAVAGAVTAWNLWRHADHRTGPAHGPMAASPVKAAMGTALIGAPLPTPPEATTPPVYVTPGLEAPTASGLNGTAETSATPAAAVAFLPAGAVYGGAPEAGDVILQARKSTGLVVRGPGGGVIFARQLTAGEAWRGSTSAGLIADVDTPSVVEVFVGGLSHGRLAEPRTALSGLVPK